jgi:hypothetical protein
MSLTEIAGHKFTDGLMRDRCSRCEIRWADAIAGRVTCNGHIMTDHYQAQFDEARQAVWDAIIGTSSGSEPVKSEPYEPEGDAGEPFEDVSTHPYCFSISIPADIQPGDVVNVGKTVTEYLETVTVHKLPNGDRVVEHLGTGASVNVAKLYADVQDETSLCFKTYSGFPDGMTWGEALALLEGIA